jgi:hypothetical protein
VFQKLPLFLPSLRSHFREKIRNQVMLPVWLVFSVTRLFFAVNPFNAHGM